jgi:hypothetical protein
MAFPVALTTRVDIEIPTGALPMDAIEKAASTAL